MKYHKNNLVGVKFRCLTKRNGEQLPYGDEYTIVGVTSGTVLLTLNDNGYKREIDFSLAAAIKLLNGTEHWIVTSPSEITNWKAEIEQ